MYRLNKQFEIDDQSKKRRIPVSHESSVAAQFSAAKAVRLPQTSAHNLKDQHRGGTTFACVVNY